MHILKSAGERYLWEKMREEENKEEEQNEEKDMEIDLTDWHDFVIVEKIDLYEDEEMKPEQSMKIQNDTFAHKNQMNIPQQAQVDLK